MLKEESFPVIDADPEVRERGSSQITLRDAANVVVDLDRRDGRIRYEATSVEIVQVTPSRSGVPSFFIHCVGGREGRPRGAAGNPLSVESARESGQHFIVVRTPLGDLLVLGNPYAYALMCVTWATRAALSQQCGDGDGETRWRTAFDLMLLLGTQLGGHVVGFNEKCGNSLESFHVVSHLPPVGFGPYPVQLAFASQRHLPIAHIGGDRYPTHVWRLDLGSDEATSDAAAALMGGWRQIAGPFASANVAAIRESERTVLYVTPRHRRLRAIAWKSPAFLELLGLFIASPEDFSQVQKGELGFDQIWTALSSLRISDAAAAEINDSLGVMTM